MNRAVGSSPELEPLVRQFIAALRGDPPERARVRSTMIELLQHLVTPRGRTDANCVATESALGAAFDWEFDWPGLPPDYQAVLFDMSSTLHDAVSAPAVAENFESTPEQLLRRAQALS